MYFSFGASFGDQIIYVLANKHELLLRTYSAAKFSVSSDKWEVSMIYRNIAGSIVICWDKGLTQENSFSWFLSLPSFHPSPLNRFLKVRAKQEAE